MQQGLTAPLSEEMRVASHHPDRASLRAQQQPSVTPESKSERGKKQRQMFPIKTTALDQKLSLTKAGVTGELRAAPCREGAASHGSSTKEHLFSLTSALRENSLEILPDTPQREFCEPGRPGTMPCNSSSLQCPATEISDQQLQFVAVHEEQGLGRDWVALWGSDALESFTHLQKCSQDHNLLCRSTRRSQQLSKPQMSCKGRAKLGRGEEKTSRTSSVINLFSKHTRTRYPLKYSEVFWKH